MSINYALEGPVWATNTITWSFAASNFGSDISRGASFSSYITQSAYQAVVVLAFQTWASEANVHFVEVADSAATDIRVGWGDFSTTGSEIGETDYNYNFGANSSETFTPDTVVRMQDPTFDPLTGSGPTGYTYQGYATQLFQVTLHEIGHALGLNHSTDIHAIMYPTAGTSNEKIDASDIAGIQALYGAAPNATATVTGASGATQYLGYNSADSAARAQVVLTALSPLYAKTLFITAGGTDYLQSTSAGAVDSATASVTLSASGTNQSIVATDGGLVFSADGGSGVVIAGDGANQVFLVQSASSWNVALGNGNNTVFAQSGRDQLASGSGRNIYYLGTGASSVLSEGVDTIVGGSGTATISAIGTGALAFGGTGGLMFSGVAGTSTVAGLGGSVTVTAATGGVFFGGSAGQNQITAASGPATIVGGGTGDVLSVGGAGSDLVAAGPGAETITGAGSTGTNTFFAGTGADLITAGAGTTAIEAGTGNDTLVGGSGTTLFAFAAGRAGGADVISGFAASRDFVTFQGYAAGTEASAVAAARVVNGASLVTLPDGTQITFLGVTSLPSSAFV